MWKVVFWYVVKVLCDSEVDVGEIIIYVFFDVGYIWFGYFCNMNICIVNISYKFLVYYVCFCV